MVRGSSGRKKWGRHTPANSCQLNAKSPSLGPARPVLSRTGQSNSPSWPASIGGPFQAIAAHLTSSVPGTPNPAVTSDPGPFGPGSLFGAFGHHCSPRRLHYFTVLSAISRPRTRCERSSQMKTTDENDGLTTKWLPCILLRRPSRYGAAGRGSGWRPHQRAWPREDASPVERARWIPHY